MSGIALPLSLFYREREKLEKLSDVPGALAEESRGPNAGRGDITGRGFATRREGWGECGVPTQGHGRTRGVCQRSRPTLPFPHDVFLSVLPSWACLWPEGQSGVLKARAEFPACLFLAFQRLWKADTHPLLGERAPRSTPASQAAASQSLGVSLPPGPRLPRLSPG